MSNARFSISSSVKISLKRGDSSKSREFNYFTDSRNDNAGDEIYSTVLWNGSHVDGSRSVILLCAAGALSLDGNNNNTFIRLVLNYIH